VIRGIVRVYIPTRRARRRGNLETVYLVSTVDDDDIPEHHDKISALTAAIQSGDKTILRQIMSDEEKEEEEEEKEEEESQSYNALVHKIKRSHRKRKGYGTIRDVKKL